MEWERIRHIPVEDNEGRLVGLVSHRTLIRLLVKGYGKQRDAGPVAVRDIMKTDPLTVAPDTSTIEAIRMMRANQVGCLPIVVDDKLVGLITERDLIAVSAQLLEDHLRAAFGEPAGSSD
jgi:CBS domain-containing protein